MSREIKFRAWHKGRMIYGVGVAASSMSKEYQVVQDQYDKIRILHDTVPMQFTGLKDCNGVEIYEKCVIDGIYVVWFKSGEYVLTDISNGDIVKLVNYFNSRSGNVKVTQQYSEVQVDT